MSDTPQPGVETTADFDHYLVQETERCRLRAELLPINKAAVFDALVTAGIAFVIVTFDGYGDSGQIESIDARAPDGDVSLPDATVETAWPGYGEDAIDQKTLPLAEAIETFCYELLRSTHSGWENSDGAYGDFTFDVATRFASLDYNERYSSVESYEHDF